MEAARKLNAVEEQLARVTRQLLEAQHARDEVVLSVAADQAPVLGEQPPTASVVS